MLMNMSTEVVQFAHLFFDEYFLSRNQGIANWTECNCHGNLNKKLKSFGGVRVYDRFRKVEQAFIDLYEMADYYGRVTATLRVLD